MERGNNLHVEGNVAMHITERVLSAMDGYNDPSSVYNFCGYNY